MSLDDLDYDQFVKTLPTLNNSNFTIQQKLSYLGIYSLICYKLRKYDECWKYYRYRQLSGVKLKFLPKILKDKEVKIIFDKDKDILSSKNKLIWKNDTSSIQYLGSIDDIDQNTKLLIWDDGGIGDWILHFGLLKLFPKDLDFKIINNSNIKWIFKDFKNHFIEDDLKYNFTHHTSILQLQSLFKIEPKNYNIKFDYLISDQNFKWFEYFKTFKDFKKIGLVLKTKRDANRNINFSYFEELLKNNLDTKFFLIDLEPETSAINYSNNYPNLIIFSNIDKEVPFIDTYSILNHLDQLITVDTAGNHFAGYLSLKTILLLNYNAHYYWGINESQSHFYKNLEILRAKKRGGWDQLINELRTKL